MPKSLNSPGIYILQKYSIFLQASFLFFIFAVLSFGRSFSILHLNVFSIPLFVTEIFLLVSLPILILRRDSFLKLPRAFLLALSAYFLFGSFYLFQGVISKNAFALRDIVFCGYILFLPLTLIVFSQERDLRIFLCVILGSNLIGMLVGRLWIFEIYPSLSWEGFLSQTKNFNLGLSYGIAASFLISFFTFLKDGRAKLIILLLLAINFYLILILGARAVWVGAISLIIYFLSLQKKKFLDMSLIFIPIFLLVGGVLFYLDFRSPSGADQKEFIVSKVVSLRTLVQEKAGASRKLSRAGASALTGKYKESYDNLTWRLSVWEQSIAFGLKRPFIGRGFGVYPEYTVRSWKLAGPKSPGIDSNVTPCHNHFISVFMKMGVLGLALFLFINAFIFGYGVRYLKYCKNEFLKCFLTASLGAFVFWHTVAFFFDLIDSPPTSIFLWIITGLIFAVVRIDKTCRKA